MPDDQQSKAHIFVDNSNIFGGAQRAAAELEPEAIWLAVRLYYDHFFQLLEHQLSPITRVLAGSVPPGNDELWKYARQAGYDTDLLKKVEKNDGSLTEQGVDEVLHLKIANVLLDFDAPQTLVLATGDAHDSDYNTSFRQQVHRALKRGWTVHVWSWKDQLSGRFARLFGHGTGRLFIHELDPWYKSITFVHGGEYDINGVHVSIKGRIVHKLRM